MRNQRNGKTCVDCDMYILDPEKRKLEKKKNQQTRVLHTSVVIRSWLLIIYILYI